MDAARAPDPRHDALRRKQQMAPRSDTDPRDSDRQVVLPGGLSDPGGTRLGRGGRSRRWVLMVVLAVVLGAGILVGGTIALVTGLGADSSTVTDEGTDRLTPADAAVVADFEAFARGLEGVSDGDAAVVVEAISPQDGGIARGTADVLLDPAGEGQMAQVAAALTDWADEAEAAGSIELDLRLSTTDGAVDLSRPGSANAERLAVAAEVVRDDAVVEFWIGESRVDLVLAAGTDQGDGLARWTQQVGEIAPTMAVAVRTADAG